MDVGQGRFRSAAHRTKQGHQSDRLTQQGPPCLPTSHSQMPLHVFRAQLPFAVPRLNVASVRHNPVAKRKRM
jgi:hypothetical protein